MFAGNQSDLQCRIEWDVSNGLGFSKSKYLYANNAYQDYLTEEEVKNTNAGLRAHLAEMNFDSELSRYFELKNKKFLGKFRSRVYYSLLQLKHGNLRDNAVNEAVENRGGLMKMVLEKKILKDNVLLWMNNHEKE